MATNVSIHPMLQLECMKYRDGLYQIIHSFSQYVGQIFVFSPTLALSIQISAKTQLLV
jgi:hypothetical protein